MYWTAYVLFVCNVQHELSNPCGIVPSLIEILCESGRPEPITYTI